MLHVKPDISISALLCTEYSSIQSGTYKISSLVQSLLHMKDNHDQEVPTLLLT